MAVFGPKIAIFCLPGTLKKKSLLIPLHQTGKINTFESDSIDEIATSPALTRQQITNRRKATPLTLPLKTNP
jgi:hypothetical protein